MYPTDVFFIIVSLTQQIFKIATTHANTNFCGIIGISGRLMDRVWLADNANYADLVFLKEERGH